MALHARLLRKKRPGDPIRAEDWNAVVEMLKRTVYGPGVTEDHLGWHVPGGRNAGDLVVRAMIVATGPQSQADFDDARYWVHRVKRVGTADPLVTYPEYELDTSASPFMAINYCECGATTGQHGFHGILRKPSGYTDDLPPRYVTCRLVGAIWHFDSYPGTMVEDYHLRVIECDENGCPIPEAWDKAIATATVVNNSPPPGCE